MKAVAPAKISHDNECLWCKTTQNVDYILYKKESNTEVCYLVIKDTIYWDKDIVNKFTYIFNLSNQHGITPICADCEVKLLAQIFSEK